MSSPASQIRTLAELFLHAAAADGVGVTFYEAVRPTRTFSYAELAERARGAAAAFRARGVQPGDRIALVLQTSPEFYEAFFGALFAGAVPTCLYPPVRLGRLDEYHERTARMLTAIGTRLVVSDRTIHRLLGKTHRAVGDAVEFVRIEDLERPSAADPEVVTREPEDLAFIQFSSGTTVEPKAVALTHRNVLANLSSMARAFPGDPAEHARHRTVSWLPLYHDMGLVGAVFLSLVTPTPLVLVRPDQFVARPRLWLEALSRTRGTITVAPNFAYGLCADRLKGQDLSDLDLSTLEVALNGAEAVHHATMHRFHELVHPLGFRREVMTPVYGLAEATLALTFSPLDREPSTMRLDADALEERSEARILTAEQQGGRVRMITSVGAALPDSEIEIRDASGECVAERRVGTVWVRGPSVMSGYYGRDDLTAASIHDGWLDTGDLGFLHEHELYLCGRAKDVLIVRGRNHDPAVIEQAAYHVQGIRTGCVVAVARREAEDTEERVVVLAERRSSEQTDEDLAAAVHRAILEGAGIHPDEVVLLDEGTLPRTSSGKLRRGEALRQLRAGELTPPNQVTWFRMARELYQGWRAHHRSARGHATES